MCCYLDMPLFLINYTFLFAAWTANTFPATVKDWSVKAEGLTGNMGATDATDWPAALTFKEELNLGALEGKHNLG